MGFYGPAQLWPKNTATAAMSVMSTNPQGPAGGPGQVVARRSGLAELEHWEQQS